MAHTRKKHLGDLSLRARTVLSLLVLATVLCACQSAPPKAQAVAAETTGLSLQSGAGWLTGYLAVQELPDSLALLPVPPTPDSAALRADIEAFQALTASGSARRQLAYEDAQLRFPQASEAFVCALNVPISQEQTPHLYTLLRRTISDAAAAPNKAKNHYQRTRPFVQLGQSTCTPEDEDALAKNGSYPSGSAVIGWTWALILAEIAPERSDTLPQRGYAVGQSRAVCGVHWQSDVNAGFLLGAGVVARLHANCDFQEQLKLARAEVEQHKAGILDSQRCTTEARALTQ